MAASAARIEANRRNARKSTGPKTAEGKSRSRANALKHGLSGAGVVLPAGDLAKVDELEASLVAEVGPRDEVDASVVRRFAVFSIRLDRCAEHDDAMTEHRVRNAAMDHDRRRWDEVEALGQRLADGPAAAVRRLKRTPEGVEWLVEQWLEIRAGIELPAGEPAGELAARAGMLLGLSPARARVSDWGVWGRAAAGDPSAVLPETDPAAWALARIDREVGALEALRDALDDEVEAANRAGAARRALLDFSPEGEKARRYEAAAERHYFRTLREIRQIQARSAEAPKPAPNEPKPASIPAQEPHPKPAPAPAPSSAAQLQAAFTAAESLILKDLMGPARDQAVEPGEFLDIAATPAAARERAAPKPSRPGLR